MTFKKVQESKEIGKEIVEGQEVAILQQQDFLKQLLSINLV